MSWWDRLLGRQELTDRIQTLETKLQEASILSQMYDPDLGLTASQGGSQYMRRLTQSPRDFPPLQHAKSIKLAFWLYETNPIARRILTTTSAYLIGDGFRPASESTEPARDKEIQRVLDTFWDDHVNIMDLKLPQYALELGMWGELCLTVNVNPISGLVRLASVDPERINDVITTDNDVVAISLKASSYATGEERLKVITEDEDPNSESFGLMMGAKPGETWQMTDRDGKPTGEPREYLGSCFFFRVNNVSNAKRGRSDLLAVMDWLDAYDQELFGEMERSQLLRAFIWDVQLEGKSEAEIIDWLKRNGSPKPGAVRAHNEGVTWNAVSPDLKVKDSTELSGLILSHVASGAQYPKTWLNVTDDVNRSTGVILDEPTFRWMTARQRYLKYIVQQIVTFQLDQAELKGGLKARSTQTGTIQKEPWNVQIQAPELRTRDLTNSANSLAAATQGLVNMFAEHFIDLETAQKASVLLVEQLGVEVDIEEMQQNIAKAIEAEEEAAMPPVVPPGTTPGATPNNPRGTPVRPGPPLAKPAQNTIPVTPQVVAPTIMQRNQKGIAV